MYAIIEDGGRQFKVEQGQELEIDYRDVRNGEILTLGRVLALRDDQGLRLGTPVLETASVTAEVLGSGRGPKLVIQKFRRRKNYRRRTGHRQIFTRVKITGISG